jgi:hypothetical protein
VALGLLAGCGGSVTQPDTASTPQTGTTTNRTIGLLLSKSGASAGYTLLAPKHYGTTYLLNLEGNAVRTWKSAYPPGQSAYLLPNGNLLRAAMIQVQGGGTGGGEGGRIEQYDWEGNLVWEYDHATSDYQLHHDITPLPNGNVLALKVERKSLADCVAMGIDPSLLKDGYLLPDSVVEVEPVRPRGGRIVWEWHVWDHMVQSFDRTKRNYADPRLHPELVAPALSGGAQIPAFWNHMNSIAHNAALDQIVLSVRGNSELWVIDHGTTTAEAAGHTGGRYGRGGDLLYRWGNPVTYAAGTSGNQMLFQQHDVQWIDDGSPGAGHFLAFNNGLSRPGGQYSSVDEFVPPVNADGSYPFTPGQAFGPTQLAWTYAGTHGTQYYSEAISGAHRLPNGNTLICYGTHGVLVEVTSAGEAVWQYVNPVTNEGPMAQGQTSGKDTRGHNWNAVFKVRRYSPNYQGLLGRDLTSLGPVER